MRCGRMFASDIFSEPNSKLSAFCNWVTTRHALKQNCGRLENMKLSMLHLFFLLVKCKQPPPKTVGGKRFNRSAGFVDECWMESEQSVQLWSPRTTASGHSGCLILKETSFSSCLFFFVDSSSLQAAAPVYICIRSCRVKTTEQLEIKLII